MIIPQRYTTEEAEVLGFLLTSELEGDGGGSAMASGASLADFVNRESGPITGEWQPPSTNHPKTPIIFLAHPGRLSRQEI